MLKIAYVIIFAIIVSISIPSAVCAAPRAKRGQPVTTGGFSVTPTAGGYFSSGTDSFESGPLYGMKFGYETVGRSIPDSLGIEATFNYLDTKSKADEKAVKGYLFRLDALYPVLMSGKTVPYLVLGLGDIVIRGSSVSDDSPFLNYGLTVKYFLEDYLALRADARHLLVYNNIDTRNNYEFSVGLNYYFGKERKKTPVPQPDADGDGVPNNLDKCPNTPKGVKIDKFGCPADSDHDGVADSEDKCPSTPMGVTVDKTGCPEALEKKEPAAAEPPPPAVVPLPAVPPAAPAPAAAAPQAPVEVPAKPQPAELPPAKAVPAPAPVPVAPPAPKPVPLPVPAAPPVAVPPTPAAEPMRVVGKKLAKTVTVQYKLDRSVIEGKYLKEIKAVAELIKSTPGATAVIEGHTDSTGSLQHNMELSKRRAESLKKTLVQMGVDPDVLTTVGYGPTKPVADNRTEKGKIKNRRAVTAVTVLIYR